MGIADHKNYKEWLAEKEKKRKKLLRKVKILNFIALGAILISIAILVL